jgi:hypothetical protein
VNKQLKPLVKTLDENYAKLPALPKGVNEFIVSVAPWLALIFGVLAVFAGLGAFGVLTALSPVAAVAGAGQYAFAGLLAAVVLLVQGGIDLWAFPSLKARKEKGWNLMFYSLLLGVVSSVVTLNVGSVVGGVVGALIGYYFLYQVKSYYK